MTRDPRGAPGAGPDRDRPAGFERWRGKRPSDILEELADGDPLEIGPRTVARVRERALLLDFERTAERAMARVALSALSYRGEPPFEQWLEARIDQAIADMLEEDATEEFEGVPPENGHEPRFEWLAGAFGLEPALARRACVRFNDLPERTRRVFVLTTLEEREDEARKLCASNGDFERRLLEAVEALAAGIDPRELDLGGTP